jgi:hypothetical protein
MTLRQIIKYKLYIKCVFLYNQRDATYTMFFIIIISVLHISGGFSAHHKELLNLYVQPWVLSCFPAVYRWCGWVGAEKPSETRRALIIIKNVV